MKISKNYQILIVFAIALFTSSVAFSQSILQQSTDQELEEAARERAEMWEGELSLSSKQTNLVQSKIIEFAIKKNRILQSKMREELKTERLQRLQVLENKDMRNILTQPQYDRYLFLLDQQIKKQGTKK